MVQGPPVASLRGEFSWLQATNCGDPDAETSGELKLLVGQRLIWGRGYNGVDWHWSDLLEGLAQNWERMLFEDWLEPRLEGSFSVLDAVALYEDSVEALARLEGLDEEAACRLLDRLYDWEQAHSLARFLPGIDVPDVYVWGSGAEVWFETEQFRGALPRAEAAVALGRLGEEVAARLRSTGLAGDPLVVAWEGRHTPADDRWAATVTGFRPEVLARARGSVEPDEAWGNEAGEMSSTAWTELARLLAPGGELALPPLFKAVADLPPVDAKWAACLDVAGRGRSVAGSDRSSFALAVAEELRGLAGLGDTDAFGVDALASCLGIRLEHMDLGPVAPAALAVHRPGHLPLIILNTIGISPSREAERRWAVLAALSQLIDAGLEGEPRAISPTLEPGQSGEDRLALELGMPGRAVEELAIGAAGAGRLGGALAIARHFFLPERAAAFQLHNGGAWAALSAHERGRTLSILESPTGHKARHLRDLPAAA